MKRILIRKCRNQSGETIAETLIALLVSALALTMLAGSITTATKVAESSDKTLKQYYAVTNTVAEGTGSSGVADGKLKTGNGYVSIYETDPAKDLLSGDGRTGIAFRVNSGLNTKPIVAYTNPAGTGG